MARFLLLAVGSLLLIFGLHTLAFRYLGWAPEMSGLERYGLAAAAPPAPSFVLGFWLLQILALIALYLIVQGRSGSWWLDGLMAAWIAWIFRGPVLVLTLEALTRLPRDPWWPLSLRWFVLYTVCGLVLAFLGRPRRAAPEI